MIPKEKMEGSLLDRAIESWNETQGWGKKLPKIKAVREGDTVGWGYRGERFE